MQKTVVINRDDLLALMVFYRREDSNNTVIDGAWDRVMSAVEIKDAKSFVAELTAINEKVKDKKAVQS